MTGRTAPAFRPAGPRRLAAAGLLLVAVGLAGSLVTPLAGDASFLEVVADARAPVVTTVAHVVTRLGDLWFVTAVAVVVAVVVRGSPVARRVHVLLVATIGGSALIVTVLKLLVARPRPAEALVGALTSAYPSGHAARAAAVYGLAVWACRRYGRPPAARTVGAVVGVVVAAGIALSRVYLGIHLPSEVGAGVLIGGAWLVAVLRTVRVPECPREPAAGPRRPEGP